MSEEEKIRLHDERFAIFSFGRFVERVLKEDEDVEDMEVWFRQLGEYPDALWTIKMKNGEEFRLNIEFEGYSSNFKDHGHNPKLCDLIVCTLHDWKDSPIPVLDAVYRKFFKVGEEITTSFYGQLKELKKNKT